MTDLAELRRLAEQAIRSKDRGGPTVEQERFEKAANPAAVLSLLDGLDAAQHVGDNCGRVLEQTAKRVAALEEGLRGLEQKAKTGAWHEKVRGGYLWAIDDARQLLQASAQDASDR